ncbi:hypothetical protein MNBD_DELTA01-123 [hydrothermal vent metagenome]|uniref:Ice-binding protein C-terminal domain-containing protein n=1 Tax=hydrothermal vent metagenome TaxID=652676 RepID=A0A3B0R6H3_9ZZZZ
MRNIRVLFVLMITLLVIFGFSVKSQATLTSIGTATYNSLNYNLIYDNDLSVTWLDYTRGNEGTPIADSWGNQRAWAAGLNGGGVLTYNLNAGVSASWSGDWRLPTVTDTGSAGCNFSFNGTDCGYNVDTSTGEMAHLFYDELANKAYFDTSGASAQPGWGFLNVDIFAKLTEGTYWSDTESSANSANAWFFTNYNGNQSTSGKLNTYLAMAVRGGGVTFGGGGGASPVPEPSTYLLLGSGIAGLIFWRRKSLLRKG